MVEELIYELSILISLKSYQLRNSIKWILFDTCTQSLAELATTVYEYIIHCYYKSLLNNYYNLSSHNMFMLLPIQKISIATSLHTKNVSKAVKLLSKVGLLEVNYKSLNRQSCYLITTEAIKRINEALLDSEEDINYKLGLIKEFQRNSILNLQKNRKKKDMIRFDLINECLNDEEMMSIIVPDEEQRQMIYIVSYYYFKYMSEAFDWNSINFNTIMKSWRNRSNRKKSELGMSYAIYKALNDNSKMPFTKKIQVNYSPDIQLSPYLNKEELNNLIYDDILGNFPEFKDWLIKYKKDNDTNSWCPN